LAVAADRAVVLGGRSFVWLGVVTMFQLPSRRKCCTLRNRVLLVVVVGVCFAATVPQHAGAQKSRKTSIFKGKLVNVKKSRRITLFTVETADKETKEFQITAKTKFTMTATGDDGFLKAGQYVSCTPVMSNNKFFGKKFTVHVGLKKPKGVLAKAPKQAGASRNAWNVAGQIVSRQSDKDFPDYEVLTLRIGKRSVSVFLDKGYSVTVHVTDPKFARPGALVELQARPASRNRLTVSNAVVTPAKPLKAAEFFGDSGKDRPSRKNRKKP
jgi:hypothetical protein